MKFTEAQLEQAFIHLLQEEQMTHLVGGEVRKNEFQGVSEPPTQYGHIVTEKVLIDADLKNYLKFDNRLHLTDRYKEMYHLLHSH